MTGDIKYQGYYEALRWAGGKECLVDLAFERGLRVTKLETTTGWLRESVLFELEGDQSAVDDFKAAWSASVDAYNNPK